MITTPPYIPVPWPCISTGTGKLVPDNRPRENPSMREISNTQGYLRGKVRGNLRGRSMHAVQSITSILLYILVSMPVKYPAMELWELHTRGRGRVSLSPYPGKYSAMELGGYLSMKDKQSFDRNSCCSQTLFNIY